MTAPQLDDTTRTELEAAAFRRLVDHLRERTDVQNIDLMNLAGFCRNCLSRWYREAAESQGIGLADPDAREIVYGMPYKEWQAKYQKEASAFYKQTQDAISSADPKSPGVQPRPTLGIQFVDIPEFTDLGTKVSQEISAAIAGQTTVESALSKGQQLADQVATKYRK